MAAPRIEGTISARAPRLPVAQGDRARGDSQDSQAKTWGHLGLGDRCERRQDRGGRLKGRKGVSLSSPQIANP